MIKTEEDDAFDALQLKLSMIAKTQADWINPDHYKIGGIETIDYMQAKSTPEEFTGHLRLTALKYLSRAGYKLKADRLEDLKKASWYLDRLITSIERSKA